MKYFLPAQFLTAFADNAVIILAIALLKQSGIAEKSGDLQMYFAIPFILLAPYVGYFADLYIKRNVMMLANCVKFIGALGLVVGLSPVASYCVIGMGAAIYSPAKYGILTELFKPQELVKANSLLESSTIVAILTGVVLGGIMADYSLSFSFNVVLALYAISAVIGYFVPKTVSLNPATRKGALSILKEFIGDVVIISKDPQSSLSLFMTSSFWALSATMRLAIFLWVPAVLHLTKNQDSSYLMGILSVGIVAGAVIVSKYITLEKWIYSLYAGVVVGVMLLIMYFIADIWVTRVFMFIFGTLGGIFAVPLNALLQERAVKLVGAGRGLAIQNAFENIFTFAFVFAYGLLLSSGMRITNVLLVLGISFLLLVGGGLMLASKTKDKGVYA